MAKSRAEIVAPKWMSKAGAELAVGVPKAYKKELARVKR